MESFIRNSLKIDDEKRILDAMRAVDKLSKKTFDQITDEYSQSFSKEQFQKLVAFVNLAGDSSRVSETLKENGIDPGSLPQIVDSLRSRGIRDTELNLSIVRGIDYYTDMVFEAFDRENPNWVHFVVAEGMILYRQCMVDQIWRRQVWQEESKGRCLR